MPLVIDSETHLSHWQSQESFLFQIISVPLQYSVW